MARARQPIPFGKRFGRLIVLRESHRKNCCTFVECRCDCGTVKVVCLDEMKRAGVLSCGCLHRENAGELCIRRNMRHGMRRTRFYKIWQQMTQRCRNPRSTDFALYGGRGIVVCERWKLFKNFLDDMHASYLEHAAAHGEQRTSIDRIDTNKNYELANCRWATPLRQVRNRRVTKRLEWNGRTQPLIDWAEELGLPYDTLKQRIRLGWTPERALTTAVNESRRRKSAGQETSAKNSLVDIRRDR